MAVGTASVQTLAPPEASEQSTPDSADIPEQPTLANYADIPAIIGLISTKPNHYQFTERQLRLWIANGWVRVLRNNFPEIDTMVICRPIGNNRFFIHGEIYPGNNIARLTFLLEQLFKNKPDAMFFTDGEDKTLNQMLTTEFKFEECNELALGLRGLVFAYGPFLSRTRGNYNGLLWSG